MKISLCLEEPTYALFQVDVLNTLESNDNHLFSVKLLGNFGKCGSCLYPAI